MGMPMPKSRSEQKRIERERGIEFISPRDFTPDQKSAIEYHQRVQKGAPHEAPPPTMLSQKPGELGNRVKSYFSQKRKEGRLRVEAGKLEIK